MYLRVMAQGLEMSDALDRVGDGFFVDDTALSESDREAEAFFDNAFEDLKLDIAHQADTDTAVQVVPFDVQLWVFDLE